MNKDIKKYKELEEAKVTTSEVLQSSFGIVFDKLEKEDFILVENNRKKETLVIQKIDKYVQKDLADIKPTRRIFNGKVKTEQDNILLAKQYLKENVYYLMKFESENITFPDVEYYISNPGRLESKNFDQEITINLINGWRFMLDIKECNGIEHMKDIQSIVAKGQAMDLGHFRDGEVSISNTSYKPPLPTDASINKLLKEFHNSTNIYKGASTLLVKLIKAQPFWDGNKRTAFLFVNKLLIEAAKGILTINDSQFKDFSNLLNDYYNDESKINNLVDFLVNNCFYNTKDKKHI